MKITDKIISIPPYISTSWDKVASLHMHQDKLAITLTDDSTVLLPALKPDVIEQLFQTHAAYLEHKQLAASENQPIQEKLFSSPLKLVFGTADSMLQALQHNPTYSDLPPIPADIAAKIAGFSRVIPSEEVAQMPNPEHGCMCMYCQMARILKGAILGTDTHPDHPLFEKNDEDVSEEDLRFEEWNVSPAGEKMYLVSNKLDSNEQYTVFLGDPIGCTCGKPHCEHIVAVLRH